MAHIISRKMLSVCRPYPTLPHLPPPKKTTPPEKTRKKKR